ncbi:tyrosine-type recombinase/integrase [Listeria welshimeri]|nr:tyrosine-type recombinase/integrase [Listeria welshimeri]MBC6181695.1 tyrosine-type recombinase/integrase [Listeria welshimeri]
MNFSKFKIYFVFIPFSIGFFCFFPFVTESTINNKRQIIVKYSTKIKSSYRTLPLVNVIEESILNAIQQQKEYQNGCGNDYNYDYQDYLSKDEFGNRFKPGYISKKFKKILIENELRIIRFHDLRHSCASLLIAEDIPLKDIQEWLGYSTLSSTADIYVHLDSKRKISSANKLANKLNTSMFSNSNGILKIYCGTCPFWDKKNTNESLETLVN